MSDIDFDRLMRIATDGRAAFADAIPFPHIVIDDFLPKSIANAVGEDFDRETLEWKHYSHYNERKLALTDAKAMPPSVRNVFEELQSSRFVDFIALLTGVRDVIVDPDLEGAGMHMTRPGGFLNVHTDFLTHTTRRSWRRQVNLLIYLNPAWRSEWNGNLELWPSDLKRCVHSVEPVFNRCVVFRTLPRSYHGHPHPLACPEGLSRKSLAIYYYRDEGVEAQVESTDYRALPSDGRLERSLIALDRRLLGIYTHLKSRFGWSDAALTRILERFERSE